MRDRLHKWRALSSISTMSARSPGTVRASSTSGTPARASVVCKVFGHRPGRLGEDDAVDAFGDEQSKVDLFFVGVVVAARDEEHVAGVVGGVFRAADHLGKERVGDVRDDHAERARLLRGEAAGHQVRLVSELRHGLFDAALERGAHVGGAVDDGRHRGDRDTSGAWRRRKCWASRIRRKCISRVSSEQSALLRV